MSLVSLAFLVLTLFSCSENEIDKPENGLREQLQNLSGTYADAAPYAYGNAFGQRTFTFDDGKWTLTFTLGLDPELNNPVFEFRTFGTYQVLEESKVVEGAFNALFLEEKKFLTLKTSDDRLAEAFGLAACGLEVNVEKDISEEGCALWAAVAECNEDHDLLMLDDAGLLYFGVRPPDNNMCSADRRPEALTPGVKKL